MKIPIQPVYDWIDQNAMNLPGWSVSEKCKSMARDIVEKGAYLSVELGVFGGRGLFSMAASHKAMKQGVALGFDPWSNAAAVEGEHSSEDSKWWNEVDLNAIYSDFVKNSFNFGLLNYCGWCRMKSDRGVRLFDDESIDLLHCDSNHSEQISCDEVERWHKKVKVGGLWYFDDVDWPTTAKAQELLKLKGYELKEHFVKWAIFKRIK